MRRDDISAEQQDVKDIGLVLNRCLDEGEHALTLNHFAALSQCKTIIEKMETLQRESADYHKQPKLLGSISFRVSSKKLLEIVAHLGTVDDPREFLLFFQHIDYSRLFVSAPPSFDEEKCKAANTSLDIVWNPTKYELPITVYVLEVGQSNSSFSEVCFCQLLCISK